MHRLLTVGHGRLDRAALGDLLTGAGVGSVVDIRRFPGSRNNPDVSREALGHWLPGLGLGYVWEEDLGGRRSLPAGEESPDTWWKVAAFRAYAAHTRTPAFASALSRVTDPARTSREGTVAVMCSESVWWRCHRRLVADVVALHGYADVQHLMPDGRCRPHPVAAGARLSPDATVVWDGDPPSGGEASADAE